MSATIDFVIFLLLLLSLGYVGAKPWQWIPVMAVFLACLWWLQTLPVSLLLIIITLFVLISAVTVIPLLRRYMISKPLFAIFKAHKPNMSETERAAIEAGDTWWDKDLFSGRPHWIRFLKTPKPVLSDREKAFLDNEVSTLCGMLDEWEISHGRKDLPESVWQYLREHRFFGLRINEQYGGLGFSELAHSSIITKIASRSVSAAVTAMVPNSLGPAELLIHYGTDEQKSYYLPRLARGEEIPCFGLTSLEAGSDAASLTDSGVVCYGEFNGEKVLGMRVSWSKRYITLAPVATLLGLAFKLSDPDHLLGKQTDLGITVCLVPTNHPGVHHGNRHLPMNLGFMNGTSSGHDVFMPLDWIIGGKANIGQGWKMLMDCLSAGRGISLPAMSAANAQVCYRTTGAYASIRQQFNLPIGFFEGVEEALARVAGFTYMIEAVRQVTAGGIDQGYKPSIISAIVKYHTTEMSRHIMNDAMDVHAGRAVQNGPRNYLNFGYQAIPIGITVEGANILTRNLMIFGQGMIRCHPYLQAELNAVSDDDPVFGLQTFDRLMIRHIGHIVSQFSRCLLKGVLPCLGRAPIPGITKSYYKRLTRMSSCLAFCSDMVIVSLGTNVKRAERLSARLGDVLSYLYLSSAALKYYQEQGHHEDDWVHVQWVLDYNLYQMGQAFEAIFTNFPNAIVGCLLRWIVFPLGNRYRKPNDQLEHQLARRLLSPCALRERLTQWCFTKSDPNDLIGRMDEAFKRHIASVHLFKKLHQGLGHRYRQRFPVLQDALDEALEKKILLPREVEQLQQCEAARLEALFVDEFSTS